MSISVGSLVSDEGWTPMPIEGQQNNPRYYWHEGGLLADAPIDFAATFAENMFLTTTPIDVMRFNRNPLKVVPNFMVPRHRHNIDETIIVLKGEYRIEFGPDDSESVIVRPGCFFTSRAGTAYTMIAGPEGVTYIETWVQPVRTLKTFWESRGWVPR